MLGRGWGGGVWFESAGILTLTSAVSMPGLKKKDHFTFKLYSEKLQLADITQHLLLKAVQKILSLGFSSQFCLELFFFSQSFCIFLWSNMTSATHKGRLKPQMTRRRSRVWAERHPGLSSLDRLHEPQREESLICHWAWKSLMSASVSSRPSEGLQQASSSSGTSAWRRPLQAPCGPFRCSYAIMKNAFFFWREREFFFPVNTSKQTILVPSSSSQTVINFSNWHAGGRTTSFGVFLLLFFFFLNSQTILRSDLCFELSKKQKGLNVSTSE